MTSQTRLRLYADLRISKNSLCLYNARRLSLLSYLAVISLLVIIITSAGKSSAERPTQSAEAISTLEQGKPVAGEIASGQLHTYRLALASDQYLRLVLDQKGATIGMALFGPDGKKLADGIDDSQTATSLLAVVESAGDHRLELRASAKNTASVTYKLTLEELRKATDRDRNRIAADRAFIEGERLRAQRTADSLRNALEKYLEALPLYQSAGERAGEAAALNQIAFIYSFSDNRKAVEYYSQAIQLYHDLGNRTAEAQSLAASGLAHKILGDHQKALEEENQALAIVRAINDRTGEATILNYIGLIYLELDDTSKAIDHLNQALRIVQAINNPLVESQILGNLAATYGALSDNAKAIDYYNQVLKITRSIGNRVGEATTLNNIAIRYSSMSEYRKSLEYLSQALDIYRAAGFRRGEAKALANMSQLYASLDEPQKAIDSFNEALPLIRAAGDKLGEAVAISNIGGVYSSLSEYKKALDSYNQALAIYRTISNRRGEANALDQIGRIHYLSNDKQLSLNHYNKALVIYHEINYRLGEASVLDHTGQLYLSLNDGQKSRSYFDQALEVFRAISNRSGEASALDHLGQVCFSEGDYQKALDYLGQALAMRQAIGVREGEAQTRYNIARVLTSQENFEAARPHTEAALKIVESQRRKVFSQQSRISYFASVRKLYDLHINLMMRLHEQNPSVGFDALALEASERAHARSLLELLAEARADIRQGVDAALLERERSLGELLSAKADRQVELLDSKHTTEQASAIAEEIEKLIAAQQQVQAAIRAQSPRYASLTQPQPMSLSDIQSQVLDEDTLLLEYALGEDCSHLWAVSTDSITSYKLAGRADVEAAARRFYEATKQDSKFDDITSAARELSRMLIAPAADRLGSKRLVIVADGILHYIPFAALPAPDRDSVGQRSKVKSDERGLSLPLIARHEIVTLPSASVLAEARREIRGRKSATREVAIFADPVFSHDDPRLRPIDKTSQTNLLPMSRDLQRAVRDIGLEGGFPRLPFSRREAEAIALTAPREESIKALDFDASRAVATSDEMANYRILHFATHGLLNSNHPELSGIVLSLVDREGKSQNGFLRLHEIYNLKLPAELVVLSACQTGLGKEARGEGLVGLTRGFMYAGAARVVASLWKVDDAATAELMKRFYRGMFAKGLRPAAALREAQLDMSKEDRWRSPYFWAAFVLQGEWR